MSSLSAIKTLLEADGTLTTAATGGIYDLDETGRLGINRTNSNTSAAFDSNGIIQPCILLRSRDYRPDGPLRDQATQKSSTREIIEVWFYDDNGYSNIQTLRNRVYALLEAQQVSGAFRIDWNADVRNQYDLDLDACVERSEYWVRALRTP